MRRIEGDQQCGRETAIGIVPFEGHLQLDGLDQVRFDDLMSVPPEYWREDADEVRCFLEEQVNGIFLHLPTFENYIIAWIV